jgi:hypothetical protein
VGFSVAGSGERLLLVRGVGPALRQFGLADALLDPRLRILRHGSTQPILENQSWSNGSDAAEIVQRAGAVGAFPLPNPSDDTAAVRAFPEGNYTAVVESRGAGTGVVLAEIYDTEGSAARLSNLSARAETVAGDGVLTAGFTVREGRRTLLIRGVGPSLARFGVANPLSEARLRIFDGGAEPVMENDHWTAAPNATAVAAATLAVGAFPLEPMARDAALLVQVEPGVYTLQVSGSGGGAGTALIEIYELR